MNIRTIAVMSVICAAAGLSTIVRGQESAKTTVWDKVYTEEQAKRGETVYAKSCAACHGEALIGGNAPPLKGDEFAFLWGDKSVGELFDRMKTLMPPENPNGLPTDSYLDVTAFVLRANSYPAGEKAMPADKESLDRIFITAKQ
jgi:cytochrome c